MKTQRPKKILKKFACIAMVLLTTLIMSVTVFAVENTEKTVVKVGCNIAEGYFTKSEDGIKSGYGYDLLQKMLVYENWKYEYIENETSNQEDLYSPSSAGKYDLILGAFKTDENVKNLDFSDVPIGYLTSLIIVKNGNNDFSVNNYEKWNGVKIGILYGDDSEADLKEYADENNFTYNLVKFGRQEELEQALEEGNINLAVIRNFEKFDHVSSLDEYGEEPFYIAVNKGNDALLTQVNDALSKLFSEDANFTDKLYQKYYGDNISTAITYFPEEINFLEKAANDKKVYKALINPDRKPLSYYDNGEIKGLLTDICKMIFERSGLTVEFIVTKNRDEYIAEMDNADIICDFTGDYGKAENRGLLRISSYYNSTTSILCRKDYDGKGNRCAIVGSTISGWLKENMDAEFISYNSVQECIDAVINKDADFLSSYTRCVQEWVYSDITNSMMVVADNHQTTDFALAVKSDADKNLSSILEKSIDTITAKDISSISDSYTYYEREKTTLLAMMYEQPVLFVIGISLLAILIFGTVILVIIIRQRKQDMATNKKLLTALNEAREADKTRSDFFSRMSHDMRTPMNGILGLVHISKDENDAEILKENMDKIEESGKYLLALINDSLNYQKIEGGHIKLNKEVVSTQRLISICTESAKQAAAAENVTFNIVNKNAKLDEYVKADVMCMRKVFLNLLSNAVKFTPSGGTVEFKIEVLGRDENMVHDRITVTDTGIGMSREFVENGLFEPFSQEDNKITPLHESAGLGLSIAKQMAELMGADIRVESTLGIGTKCVVDLDFEIVEPDEMKQGEKNEASEQKLLKAKLIGKKILLAEDHPLNAQIAIKLLEKAECRTTWAKDGQEAVNMFETSEIDGFDVILMDIRMPVLNGIEAAMKIRTSSRKDAKTVPIIAVTANVYDEDVDSYYSAGMDGYLPKPIEPEKMYETISKVISKKK